MKDALGKRMKERYEHRSRTFLPRRTYTIIRVDGKCFHTLLKHAKRPFCDVVIHAMDKTAQALCEEISGAQFAYVQSDEISILVTDFTKPETEAWFNGNVQKIVSISAAKASIEFNYWANGGFMTDGYGALFDSRVFTIPDPVEVENYFIWRQKDWLRNSLHMVARTHYSHKALKNKSQSDVHEMIHQAGDNWATNYSSREKNGGLVAKNENGKYRILQAWPFLKDRESLSCLIPLHWEEDYGNEDS